MILEQTKNTEQIKHLILRAHEVHIEQDKDSNITRITLGPLNYPLCVIEKAGDYCNYFAVKTVKMKTVYRSSTLIFGNKITRVENTEAELAKWEDEIKEQYPNQVFTHTTEEVEA